MPGLVVASNITPDVETGIGSWSDGEKIRSIREGVDRDGNALLPMMPYTDYRLMSDMDVESVVAYLNSLAPIRHALPKTRVDFPINLLIKSVPRPVGHVAPPERSDPQKYGKYLAALAGCGGCHTIFLSFALAWAEVLKCYDIFIGVNALDYSGYPDDLPLLPQSRDLSSSPIG